MKTQLFYSSYLTTYLEKDLKELVYDNYSKQVGVSTNTIKAWISVLVKTGIVYLVETYNEESIIKRVVKRPKMDLQHIYVVLIVHRRYKKVF